MHKIHCCIKEFNESTDFYCDQKEADTKIFAYFKFL